jgi:glycosyltransferase involved in cell wall biosynthesis
LKEAVKLAGNGYAVNILTAVYSDMLLAEDRQLLVNTGIGYEFYSDLRRLSFNAFRDRLVRRLAVFFQVQFNLESRFSLGYNPIGLERRLKKNGYDLYIMHQELPTVTGIRFLKKIKIAFDLEDWYSEDLLPAARKGRPIRLLKNAEAQALKCGTCCYTTSQAMAKGLSAAYGSSRVPAVIYNSFHPAIRLKQYRGTGSRIRLYWFSQTIGPGRGLEHFICGLAETGFSWELNLRGQISESYLAHLKQLVDPKDRLNILPLLANDSLLDDMSNYDIGLALEPDSPPNKDLTISNKFFHYMAGGLPVVASDTAGHREIGEKHPDIVFLYKNGDKNDLKSVLTQINSVFMHYRPELNDQVKNTYASYYSWQLESEKLLQLVRNVIE